MLVVTGPPPPDDWAPPSAWDDDDDDDEEEEEAAAAVVAAVADVAAADILPPLPPLSVALSPAAADEDAAVAGPSAANAAAEVGSRHSELALTSRSPRVPGPWISPTRTLGSLGLDEPRAADRRSISIADRSAVIRAGRWNRVGTVVDAVLADPFQGRGRARASADSVAGS
jgi:hypothetical protein